MDLREKIKALTPAQRRAIANVYSLHPDTVRSYGQGKVIQSSNEAIIRESYNALVNTGEIVESK